MQEIPTKTHEKGCLVSFETASDAVNWIMMYGKNNSQEEGTYTYQPLVSH